MDKNTIIAVLNDWNFWRNELTLGFARGKYIARLHDLLASPQVVVVTGPRRAGKSYIMRQLAADLISKGIPKENILIANFEDPRFGKLDAEFLQKIFETYLEYLSPKGEIYTFLDEVHEVKEWEKWVTMMHELNKARVIITGSNAKLLSRELSTLLTGRHVDMTVFPLSFEERLFFDGIEIKDQLDLASRKIGINTVFRDYIENGSFPNVALSKEKKQVLLNYFEDIINKDLIKRFKIRKTEQLTSLAMFYLSNVACPITFNSAEKFLNISADTALKFSGHFEEVYLFFFLKRFSLRVKEQLKSPRKVYSVDTGLANTMGFRTGENIGRLAESLVFMHLMRQVSTSPEASIYYWKDLQHREVDFVVKEGQKVSQLIQVCWEFTGPDVKERETKPLIKAMNEFGLNEGTVITGDLRTEENIGDNRRIHYLPIIEWLLKM